MEGKKSSKSNSIPPETITWLLDCQTPSIRSLTLTNLLHKPLQNADVLAVRSLIPTSNPVKAIFSKQDPEGFWVSSRHDYTPKYRSSHWTMFLLTELAVPPEIPAMQKGSAFLLNRNLSSFPYSYKKEEEGLFGCFWGNWLHYHLYCGRLDDPSVQHVIEVVCKDILRLGKCRYNYDLPCAWAVIRDLYRLALIPENQRSAEVDTAIKRGIQFMIEDNDLLSANYPYQEQIHPLWFKLSFPLFYHTDILFVLRVLKELKALDHPNAAPALKWLKNKQTQRGTWSGGSPFKSRTRPFLVKPDTPNHWITLQAASIFS